MATPKFSLGVDADPMMVEQTINKTLDQIIKERKKEKGEPPLETVHLSVSLKTCCLYFLSPLDGILILLHGISSVRLQISSALDTQKLHCSLQA